MLLCLMRHGVAEKAADGKPDAPRKLTDKGARKVRRAAAGLHALARPDWILTSGLTRSDQTAELVAGVLKVKRQRIRRTPALEPDAPPSAVLAEVAELEAACVLCIGHSPQLDRVLARALAAKQPLTRLRKAGVACVELDPRAEQGGQLRWLLEPRALRKLGRG